MLAQSLKNILIFFRYQLLAHEVETMRRATLSRYRSLDLEMARLECERSSSSRFYRRVQPSVLSCMTDIDMCTRVLESKSRRRRRNGPFLPSGAHVPLSSSLVSSHSFSERKFVHEKSGKLDEAIASTVADERSSNERSAGIP